jgi:hypothetical protein
MDRLIAKGEAIGVASGKAVEAARMLLRHPDSRSDVPGDFPKQVEDCTDAGRIEAWFDRALTATTLDQVFAG